MLGQILQAFGVVFIILIVIVLGSIATGSGSLSLTTSKDGKKQTKTLGKED